MIQASIQVTSGSPPSKKLKVLSNMEGDSFAAEDEIEATNDYVQAQLLDPLKPSSSKTNEGSSTGGGPQIFLLSNELDVVEC